ncbi:MAG: RluA family pseudouridine synthase [Candidatus Parcubacteria bacterium]|nr:RluA family pseudouridine synthase [Candidatus Parcubacteria bacterium]
MEDIKIIYEDEDILAVNKPAGLLVHSLNLKSQKSNLKSLVDWILKKYPEIKNVGEDAARPGIVHRLDRDTSGVLLVAKNQKSFEYLKKQFIDRKVKKNYLVLVNGNIKNNTGIIDLPIGRSRTPLKRLASEKARGKLREAITEYKILKRFDKYTLVEVFPKTGRTHQIRVHFKAIGHPVVGDKLYGKPDENLNRQFLHANSLEFNLQNGTRIKIEADLPDDLKNFLNMLNYEYDKN